MQIRLLFDIKWESLFSGNRNYQLCCRLNSQMTDTKLQAEWFPFCVSTAKAFDLCSTFSLSTFLPPLSVAHSSVVESRKYIMGTLFVDGWMDRWVFVFCANISLHSLGTRIYSPTTEPLQSAVFLSVKLQLHLLQSQVAAEYKRREMG